jgi:hypothetical protein
MLVLIVTPASEAIRELFAARRPFTLSAGKKGAKILVV